MKKNKQIENLIFDLGGVIILSDKVDFSEFDDKFSLPRGTAKKVVSACFKKKETQENFDVRSYFKKNFEDLLSFQEYNSILEAVFQSERVNKELVSWIEKKRNDYTILLLTNNTPALGELLGKKFKIEHLFDYVFNSAEIGLAKPDPEIFKYVLNKTGNKPEACFFVDNSPENTKTASNLGLNTVTFQGNNNFFKKIESFQL